MRATRSSVTFSWLHITDLHQGQRGQAHLFPRVQTLVYDDLRELHDKTGPWDLILFTGDLTQRGAREEFDALNRTLLDLWAFLESLGSQPMLLAVPGNHDLVRPKHDDPRIGELARWWEDPAIAERFWSDPESAHRALAGEAFANYSAWWNDHPFQRVSGRRGGILPGDFTVIVEKRGCRLGVMGLNSAFLQLSDGDHEGKLDVGLPQFHDAAGGNAPSWARGCHAALLLTHHPASWLSPRARETFTGEIASQFVAHLHGHMHEPEFATQRRIGERTGYRWLQGRSLFGLEHWGGAQLRSHGYSVGRLLVQGGSAALQIWPRVLLKQQKMKLVPDLEAGVAPAKGWMSETVPLRKPFVHTLPYAERGTDLAEPDAVFDRHWYVRRSGPEAKTLGYLDVSGKPAVLLGPEDMGKTWLCKHICDHLRRRVEPIRVAEVDVGTLVGHTRAGDTKTFLYELCVWVAAAVHIDKAEVTARWAAQARQLPKQRATHLFEDLILPSSPAPLVVAIDRLEAIPEAVRTDLFSLLRRWCDARSKPPWDRMRLLLVIPRIPDLGDHQSPFTISRAVPIDAFSLDETEELFSFYGLHATDRDLAAAHRKLGGHPFWLRRAAYEARARETGLPAVIKKLSAEIADLYRERIRRRAPWREALRRIGKGQSINAGPRTIDELYDAGLIVRAESASPKYELRMKEPLLAALKS